MIDEDLNKKVCEFNKFMRVRYFHGMLLDDKDFTTEQQYHIEKRKLLNRMLHGWGVVCGLDIEWEKGKHSLKVMPGMALDCRGNEIMVCEPVTIDLAKMNCCLGTAVSGGQMTAADCEEQEQAEQFRECYIGIRYDEKRTAPIPVYIPGDECEKRECDHSRWREGFCIDICKDFPPETTMGPIDCSLYKKLEECEKACSGYQGTASYWKKLHQCKDDKIKQFMDKKGQGNDEQNCSFCFSTPPCPDCCPEDHYVILGKINIKLDKKAVEEVFPNKGRRYVFSINLVQHLVTSIFGGVGNYSDFFKSLKHFFQEITRFATENPQDGDIFKNMFSNPVESLCRIGEMYTPPPEPQEEEVIDCEKKIKELEKKCKEAIDCRKKIEELEKKCKILEEKFMPAAKKMRTTAKRKKE